MKTELIPGEFDVVVTNYESILSERALFGKFVWRYLGKRLISIPSNIIC